MVVSSESAFTLDREKVEEGAIQIYGNLIRDLIPRDDQAHLISL